MPRSKKASPTKTVNFFISYTQCDVEYAKWVAWELGRAGFTYRIQAEHFPPGARFIHEMKTWLQNADHVLAILSSAYIESPYASLELNAAVADDPQGKARKLIPVRIEECSIPAIYKDIVYIDFVGKSEEEARRALVAGIRAARVGIHTERQEIKKRPIWPGSARVSVTESAQELPVRIQFLACDVGRGLDLKGQFKKIKASIKASHFSKQLELQAVLRGQRKKKANLPLIFTNC